MLSSSFDILPEGWNWSKIKDIGDVFTGKTPRKSEKENYGNDYPFFKPPDLNKGYYVRTAGDNLSEIGIRKVRKLPPKSVLVTCIGATMGKTGFIRVEG
ncbi:MAG: restriction endonuclease subunit S, partial [Candidatus Heimdallarchaeota archaeon]|nr:restriction endonuclease subunit S [Candidatus Heimdallarchaeota archaeon]